MNKKTVYALMGVVSILTVGKVNAATVFAPTDGDVNFLFGNLAGGTLAIFDDSDVALGGPNLTVDVPGIVGITGPFANNDHVATNTNGTLTLTGSDQFRLGLLVGGIWLADSLIIDNGGNSYTVGFETGATVLEVDVRIIPPIPVPAAVWLFGSGLIGLVGVARRKALAA